MSEETVVHEEAELQDDIALIRCLLEGVHVAATAEALALGVKIGLDTHMLFRIIRNAAGASEMFKNRVPKMRAAQWSAKSTVKLAIDRLV